MASSTYDKQAAYAAAVDAVASNTSLRKAAKMYGVNRENLRKRVNGLVPMVCRPGPQLTYLSPAAEVGLVETIEYRAAQGMCIGSGELRYFVRQAAIISATRPVPDDFPNDMWIHRWMKKHPHLSFRRARILETKRAESSTEAAVSYYFNNLQDALDRLGLRDKPAQIWNCDETGICPQGRCRERVICPKGQVANVQRSSDRENVSVMGCINAAGEHVPPMYIFSGVRRKVEWMRNAPDGAVCAVTKTSNINTPLFQRWLGWFISKLPEARPQLLVLDGHFAHISPGAVKYGLGKGVHLFVLPAHTSHFLQPLDIAVYQPFKVLYEKELKQYPLDNKGALPTKDNLVGITAVPFKAAFSTQNARKAFEAAGIFPLSLEVMLSAIVGNKPSTQSTNLRHHAVVVPHHDTMQVTERQQRVLKRLGLDIDALRVVNLTVQHTFKPRPQKRVRGSYVDESFSGGVLLTHSEMLEEMSRKERKHTEKVSAQASKPLEKSERELMNMHDSPRYHSKKTSKALTPPSRRAKATSKTKVVVQIASDTVVV